MTTSQRTIREIAAVMNDRTGKPAPFPITPPQPSAIIQRGAD
jgi:hypothetical protein